MPFRGGLRWLVLGAVACAVGVYYRWDVRAAGNNFEWGKDLTGYYNYLAQGFTQGHLYLPIEPDPRLLALPNPVDPKAGLDLPKLFDGVLYNRRYYLYHGAGPAVMLFAPWRLLTGHDMPENYALFLFCFGGFLCSSLALMKVLSAQGIEMPLWALAVVLIALACCQSVPFLTNRIWVYELAIGGGYFCVAAGLLCFVSGWYIPAGLMFGVAVSCRPHLGVFGALAVVSLALTNRRRLPALLTPFILVGLAIAAYNYERFGNPLEFGLTYQVTGPFQGRVIPRLVNVIPGMYYNLIAGLEWSKVFPWFIIPASPAVVPRPPEYFIEPIVGALWLAPFLPFALGVFFIRGLRAALWTVPVASFAILFFLTLTGLSTQRYEVDFLPWLTLAAMAVLAALITRSRGVARVAAGAFLVVTVTFGTLVNMAMAIQGPYGDVLRYKPQRYVAAAKYLSPFAQYRPVLNPAFDVRFLHTVPKGPDHVRTDLFHAGQSPMRYELFLDRTDGKAVIVSAFNGAQVSHELPDSEQPVPFEVRYLPASAEAVVSANGTEIIRQKLGALVAAPADIEAPAR